MGNVTSTLTMKMIDGVTAPSKKIEASLKGVGAAAKRIQSQQVRALETSLARQSMGLGREPGMAAGMLAGGGRMLLGAAAAYATVGAAKASYKEYADYERAITRILITAEASGDEAQKTKKTIKDIARDTALPVANVTAGLDTLVAAGRTLPEAMGFLPSIARTAQAAGAEITDIAKTADAAGFALKIPAENMEEAFDKMAKAGKLGKFELKDMAQHLPSLLPLASSKGFQGMEGLEKVVSYLQMIRQGTGTSEEAADSFRDMMGKISSQETVKKFSRFGIDVKKELKKVREAGGNEFDAMFGRGGMLETAMRKGAQVTDLFQDIQAYRGALAFKNALPDMDKYRSEVKNAAGTVMNDLARVTGDAASSAQRFGNAWDNSMKSLGKAMDAAGASTALEGLAAALDKASEAADRFNAARDKGKSPRDAFLAVTPDASGREKAQLGEVYDFMTGAPQSAEYKDMVEQDRARRGAAVDSVGAHRRADRALREVQRLAKIEARYPEGLPPALQAQKDAAAAALKNSGVDAADQRLVDVSLGPNFDSSSEDRQHAARRGRAAVGGGSWPMPTARPADLSINAEAKADADFSVAVEKASAAAADIQALFDRIEIRPKLIMPPVPAMQGGLVSGALDGSHSDNGGRR